MTAYCQFPNFARMGEVWPKASQSVFRCGVWMYFADLSRDDLNAFGSKSHYTLKELSLSVDVLLLFVVYSLIRLPIIST